MALEIPHYQQLPLDRTTQVVAVDGDLDIAAAPAFAAALDDAIDSGRTRLVIDLSRVRFMDSTAIHVVVAAARELRQRLGKLALVAADPNVRRLVELTRLDLMAPLFESREAALRSLLDS
jgi:anti-sigma B factor antagonist